MKVVEKNTMQVIDIYVRSHLAAFVERYFIAAYWPATESVLKNWICIVAV